MTVPIQQKPVGYGQLIRTNRNFRLVWLGQVISLTGDWFDLIASASLLAILGQPALAIGALFVVRMLAPFVVTPLAGVLADRFNRKYLLVITDLLRAAIVLCFLLVRRPEDAWLVYAITGLQLGLGGVYFPARSAILPDLVSGPELGAANALSAATWSVMLAFGAALGGLATGQFGVYPSFMLDALTFVLSGLLESQIRYHYAPADDERQVTISGAFKQYIDGLRYLRENVDILLIALHKAAASLIVSGAFQVIQVTLAEKMFVIGKEGGTGLGIMYGVVGVGTGIGPIVARMFTGDRDRPMRIAIALGYALNAIGMVIMLPLASFGWLLVGMAIRGIGTGLSWVLSSQLLLQLLPNRVRGRVFSTEFAMLTLMNATGSAIGGWAIDSVPGGIPVMLGWMGGLILIPGLLWTAWIVFGKPRPPGPAPSELIPLLQPTEAGQR
jgi:MFS family permease